MKVYHRFLSCFFSAIAITVESSEFKNLISFIFYIIYMRYCVCVCMWCDVMCVCVLVCLRARIFLLFSTSLFYIWLLSNRIDINKHEVIVYLSSSTPFRVTMLSHVLEVDFNSFKSPEERKKERRKERTFKKRTNTIKAIYIYILRERERERDRQTDRERERERERERARKNLANRNGVYLIYFLLENRLSFQISKFIKMKGKRWTSTYPKKC